MSYQSPARGMQAEIPVRFTIHHWRSFFYADGTTHGVLVVGAHKDSVYAFLVKRTGDDITTNQLLLAVDHRPPPFDKVRLTVGIIGLRMDGDNEPPLAYIFSDERPNRMLYCVRLDTLAVVWQRSAAAPVQPAVANLRDSLGRHVTAFCTGNPANGLTDDEFDDRYTYLFMVDDSGGMVLKSLIACNWEQRGAICPTGTESELYVVHSLAFVDAIDSSSQQVRDLKLSKIRVDGTVVHSTDLTSIPEWVRIVPYEEDGSPHVFVRTTRRELAIYDTTLTLIAQAENTDIGYYRGEVQMAGIPDPVYVFSDGLYDRRFRKLLTFPIDAHSAEPIVLDSSGHALELAITGPNTYYIGAVRRKTPLDLASVFYHRNQNYVLAVLGVLLSALLFMTWYRWRTKRELEMFRLRQEMVIAEEKYAQARNIAGGFAHEIRNALFPADGVLTKLTLTKDLPSLGHERLARSHYTARDAIARAIEITQLISTYTKLDSERSIEPVELKNMVVEVVSTYSDRIAGAGVEVRVIVPGGCRVAISRTHLRMVLVNLLLNSLDALVGRDAPRIVIRASVTRETVTIEFEDNGPGIPENVRPRIYDAFFSTKPSSGTGLGLSVVKRIIQMYEGSIDVTEPTNNGATFIITLDAYTEPTGRRQ
ncbi:HAMP domain-containing histidine kinase [bacterium]|nr:HAMP domain-containing histidine kinase [bacterium]MCB2201974.1 HAMP domain-containing histidine kinase [bacterium]